MCKWGSWAVQTFRKWREDRKTDKEKKQAEAEAERKRKGILTGREIFMEVSPRLAAFPLTCMAHCSGLVDYMLCRMLPLALT